MSMKKTYLKTKPICKVRFAVPKEAHKPCKKVNLVGEFNNWNASSTPMTEQKDGTFTVTLDLQTGKEYQFRYLIDGTNWENDKHADKYVPTIYGDCENSVVVV